MFIAALRVGPRCVLAPAQTPPMEAGKAEVFSRWGVFSPLQLFAGVADAGVVCVCGGGGACLLGGCTVVALGVQSTVDGFGQWLKLTDSVECSPRAPGEQGLCRPATLTARVQLGSSPRHFQMQFLAQHLDKVMCYSLLAHN